MIAKHLILRFMSRNFPHSVAGLSNAGTLPCSRNAGNKYHDACAMATDNTALVPAIRIACTYCEKDIKSLGSARLPPEHFGFEATASVPVELSKRACTGIDMAAVQDAMPTARFGLVDFDAIDTSGRPELDDEEQLAGDYPGIKLTLGDDMEVGQGHLYISSKYVWGFSHGLVPCLAEIDTTFIR